jgi:hypothetical protein
MEDIVYVDSVKLDDSLAPSVIIAANGIQPILKIKFIKNDKISDFKYNFKSWIKKLSPVSNCPITEYKISKVKDGLKG